jgi:hypothetical protein
MGNSIGTITLKSPINLTGEALCLTKTRYNEKIINDYPITNGYAIS